MHFGGIRPNWRASSEIGAKSFRLRYGHPWFTRKHLVRAMQRTQFHAKSAKIYLKPTDILKRNFYFQTEEVPNNKLFLSLLPSLLLHYTQLDHQLFITNILAFPLTGNNNKEAQLLLANDDAGRHNVT